MNISVGDWVVITQDAILKHPEKGYIVFAIEGSLARVLEVLDGGLFKIQFEMVPIYTHDGEHFIPDDVTCKVGAVTTVDEPLIQLKQSSNKKIIQILFQNLSKKRGI